MVLTAIFIYGCSQTENQSYEGLSIDRFEKSINQPSKKIILDVRTPKEYDGAHIKNSTLIDVYDPAFEQKINTLDKSKPVYVYCASGIRSERAATTLKKNGFKEIYHMEGGLNEWIEANKPVEN